MPRENAAQPHSDARHNLIMALIFAAREVVWAWVFIVWYDEWPVRTYAAAAWTTAAGAVTLGALGSWAGGALGGALRPGRADVDLLIILAGTVVPEKNPNIPNSRRHALLQRSVALLQRSVALLQRSVALLESLIALADLYKL